MWSGKFCGGTGGINLYAYVENDPLDNVDPLGLWVVPVGLVISGRGPVAGAYEVGIAIDGEGHIATYDTATASVGAGLQAGAAVNLTDSPTLNSVAELQGTGVSVSGAAGAGVQLGTGVTVGAGGTPSYSVSVGGGAGAAVSTGISSTSVSCFNCGTPSLK